MIKFKLKLTPGCSIGIVILGILIQAIAGLLALALPSVLQMVVATIIFFMPVPLGVIGVVVGIKCFRNRMGRLLPLLGIILNALWIGLLAFVCHMIFVVGITA